MNFHILQLWHAPVLDRSLIYITSVKIYLSPGCYVPSIWMRSLIPGATTGQVTLLLSLSADMTCATSHAIKLLRCHKAWSLMLLTGCASCSCQMWKIKEVPGNSSWPFLPAPPSAAARMGWDVSGSCYCLRKLYNSGVALEKSLWPIRISRAGNVSVKNPRHLHELPLDKWNRTHHSLFLLVEMKEVSCCEIWLQGTPLCLGTGYYLATLCDLVIFTFGERRVDLNE